MAIINDKNDQSKLKQSGLILGSCLIQLGKIIKPGISAGDLNRFAIEFIHKHEAKTPFLGYMGFPHALCTSINNEVVHGLSNDEKILKEGDLVSLDLGVDYQGLITDSARTYLVSSTGIFDINEFYDEYSKPSISKQLFSANKDTASTESKLKLIIRTKEALKRALNAVKSNGRIGDIGAAVSNYVNTFGYGNVSALGGHGVGRSVHEPPYIPHFGKQGQGSLLVENMVIAIEPMITMGGGKVKFIPDKKYGWDEVFTADYSLAAHYEDTLIITKKGCEILTQIEESDILAF